jgi:glycosyltransferase involved in cell wall biosynthesis
MLTINKMFPPEIGGVEVVAKQITSFFQPETQQVVCFNSNMRMDIKEDAGVTVTRLPSIPIYRKYRYSPLYHRYIAKLSKKHKIRIYHFPSLLPEIEYCLHRKRPGIDICLYHADTDSNGIVGLFYRIYGQVIVKPFLKKMDKIIATSPNIVQSSPILHKFSSKCHIIPLAVDTDHFYYRETNPRTKILSMFNTTRTRIPDTTRTPEAPLKIILFVGRAAYYKGIEVLLKALPGMDPCCRLVLISSDSLIQYENLIKALEIENRVTLLPYKEIGYTALPEYYSAADIFTMPSTDRAESFGLVALEAMACGVPVITTELGTGSSYPNLDGVTGKVIAPGDPKALADAVNHLITQPPSRTAIIQRAQEFSLHAMRERWLEFITQLDAE